MMVAALILIADLIADGDVAGSGSTLRWSFGITTLAFRNFFASSLSSSPSAVTEIPQVWISP